MSVMVRIPSLLHQQTKGQKVVEVTANDALECLNNLTAQFPGLQQWLYDKQGELWPQVRIFMNGEQASAGELLKDGDRLSIMLVIARG
jgi:molybdopterin converting factor small subunit